MIKENIFRVRERIASACAKIRRDPGAVAIVAVGKSRSAGQIKEAIACGIADIGENKVQEAIFKFSELQINSGIRRHMVGHLQGNKAKNAVKIFDLIQSVDTLRLAAEIDKEAAKINKVQDILLEVKTSLEPAKFGLKPDEAVEVVKEIAAFKNINIKGLMTVAPVVSHPQETRPYFRILRALRDKINGLGLIAGGLQLLSMGMSDDFEVAIEEGANMVRLGRVIFEGGGG